MNEPDQVFRSRRVVLREGVRPAAVHVRDGRIARVGAPGDIEAGAAIVDLGETALLPGLVDTHVHVNEPGRTEWEGFESATRAAAAGGITTLVDMPLNSVPPTTTLRGLDAKLEAARGKCRVDVGFWGGVVPGNAGERRPLARAGVLGFKCFLVDSGVPEFARSGEEDLRDALPELAEIGAPLLVHAELPGPIERARTARRPGADPRRYRTYLESRPKEAEDEAVALLVRLAREHRARVHVVHLSSPDAIELVRRAREEGVSVSAETCPHYLALCAEEVPDGATEFKCAPPIREAAGRERLWQGLRGGVIEMVVSDHSPSPPAAKLRETGDFLRAWGGIASLQLGLSIVWSEASTRGFGLGDLAEWMCGAPARLAGLDSRKGSIEVGRDADLVVFRPEAELRVEPDKLFHRHPLTPYAGRLLRGVVEETYLRGRKIYDRGRFPGPPAGELPMRG